MRKIQRGQLDLLGILFSRHSQKIYAQCVCMTRNKHQSEDLVQEAFVRVLRYRNSFKGDAKFSTWLYKIANNVCLDHIEKQKKEHSSLEKNAHENFLFHSVRVESNDELLDLRNAINELPIENQQILFMSKIDGIGYKEIADYLGISEGAARVRVHRTVCDLKTIFDQQQGDES